MRVAPRGAFALSTVMGGGFARTFHGHPLRQHPDLALHFPRSSVRPHPAIPCTFHGHYYSQFPLQCVSGLVPPAACARVAEPNLFPTSPSCSMRGLGREDGGGAKRARQRSQKGGDGNAAHSARICGRCALRPLFGVCRSLVRGALDSSIRRRLNQTTKRLAVNTP